MRDIEELRGFRRDEEGLYFLGALTSHADVARHPQIRRMFPALAEASAEVGSEAVRAAGTIGGNLCTAAPSADAAGPLLAYGAEALVARAEAVSADVTTRTIPLSTFFVGPRRVALSRGDILVGLRLPDHGPHGACYQKFTRRKALDIATVAVTALVSLDTAGRADSLTLALGAVAPTPILVPDVSATAAGRDLSDELLADIARDAVAAAAPIDDVRAGAAYRRHLVAVLTRRAVRTAWGRAQTTPTGTRGTDGGEEGKQ